MHIIYNAANICERLPLVPYEGVVPRLMIAALTALILSDYTDNGDVPLTNVHMCASEIVQLFNQRL